MTKTNSGKRAHPIPDFTLIGDGAIVETGEMELPRLAPKVLVSCERSEKERPPRKQGDTLEGKFGNVLDIGDIAALFRCSREKVKRMARCGELPAFKFGKNWYVLDDDLERFLSNRVESSRHLRRIQEVSP